MADTYQTVLDAANAGGDAERQAYRNWVNTHRDEVFQLAGGDWNTYWEVFWQFGPVGPDQWVGLQTSLVQYLPAGRLTGGPQNYYDYLAGLPVEPPPPPPPPVGCGPKPSILPDTFTIEEGKCWFPDFPQGGQTQVCSPGSSTFTYGGMICSYTTGVCRPMTDAEKCQHLSGVTPPTTSEVPATEDCMCNASKEIAEAIRQLGTTLYAKVQSPCEQIDGCLDEIITKLSERLKSPTKTCEQCKTDAAAGLSGTLEYAVACAGACIQEVEKTCSPGAPETWGKPCQSCGKAPCCCNKGTCEPCEPEKEKPVKWVAWCYQQTQSVAARKDSDGSPGPDWVQVGLTDSEQAAIETAIANCRSQQQRRPPLDLPTIAGGPPGGIQCLITGYTDGSLHKLLTATQAGFFGTAGTLKAVEQVLAVGAFGISGQSVADALSGLLQATYKVPNKLLAESFDTIGPMLGCQSDIWKSSGLVLGTLGLWSKYVGYDYSEFALPYKYIMNSACRQKQLTPDQALAGYYGHAVDDDELDSYWAIDGYCPDALRRMAFVGRAKPVPLELAFMRRRDIIGEPQYNEGMRQLGYVEQPVVDNLFKLTEQVPTMSDLTHMLLRDAGDENIPFWCESDRIFQQKYKGDIETWAKSQGIPERFFKLYWRAHWQLPSVGQLFEFWRRLRHNPKFGGEEKLLESIKGVLLQNDVLPFWHDHYLAISYTPLTRRDIRRAFEIGVLSEKEVYDAFLQLGHSDEVGKTLTGYVVRLRDVGLRKHDAIGLWRQFAIDRAEVVRRMLADRVPQDKIDRALADVEQTFDKSPAASAFAKGLLTRAVFVDKLRAVGVSIEGAAKIADRLALRITRHTALKKYAIGALDRAEAFNQMSIDGMDSDVVRNILDDLDADIETAQLARCQAGIKHRYLVGELTKEEAARLLVTNGTATDWSRKLVGWWDCEKSSIGHAVPASQLCHFLERGVIDANNMRNRLVRMGYKTDDASYTVGGCVEALAEKRAKLERKALHDREAQERKDAQQMAKVTRQMLQGNRQATARIKAVNDAKKRREKMVIDAANKVHKKCGCDLFDAIGAAKVARARLTDSYHLTVDEALQVVVKAAEAMEKGDLDSFNAAIESFAMEALEAKSLPLTNGHSQ